MTTIIEQMKRIIKLKQINKLIILIAALLLAGVTAMRAQTQTTGQYVIYDGNGHYLGGTSTTAISVFNPNTCLWTGTSGNTWRNSANYYLRMDRYNFELSTTNSVNLTLQGTENGTTGRKIYNAYSTTRYYYLRYNNGWVRGDRQTSASTAESGTNVVFAVTQYSYSASNPTEPTITAALVSGNTGIQFTHNEVTGTFQPAYEDYVFYNGTHHYWYDNATLCCAIKFCKNDAINANCFIEVFDL